MTSIKVKIKQCFQCGNPATNYHHVIPQTFKPKKNLQIPLCDEHKDITHTLVKQVYIPPESRMLLSKAQTELDILKGTLRRIETSFKVHKKIKKTTYHVPVTID